MKTIMTKTVDQKRPAGYNECDGRECFGGNADNLHIMHLLLKIRNLLLKKSSQTVYLLPRLKGFAAKRIVLDNGKSTLAH